MVLLLFLFRLLPLIYWYIRLLFQGDGADGSTPL